MASKVTGFQDTIDWYNANAQEYASSIQDLPSRDLLTHFIDQSPPQAKILDAGCAAGRDSKLFYDSGLLPVGVDIAESLLAVARQKYPQIEFVHANFLNLPFPDQTFNGIWAHASLVHFETIEQVKQALNQFHRVLKPQGLLAIFVKQQLGNQKTSVVTDKLSNYPRFFRWYTKDELQNLLKSSGFKINTVKDHYKDPANLQDVEWIYVSAQA